LGLETVEDLLTHYPRRHEDRHQFPEFPREESDTPICLCGEVVKTSLRRFGGWKKIFEVTLQELHANALSQPLVCRWFNLHYVQKMIVTGQRLVVFGKPRLRGNRICMDHPEFEVIENDEEMSIHFRRITPIYPATEGLSQRALRGIIYRILRHLDNERLETLLPAALDGGDRTIAIRRIHFPEDWESLSAAREHLVLSEFFGMQMLIAARRAESSVRTGAAHCGRGELLEKFLGSLPFEPTDAQSRVIAEIRRDLAANHPMNRLLQGDVGSGKTVVAIAAILLAVEAGYQAAFMAPTQILAEQHYAVLRRWLEPLGVKLALRTGAHHEDNAPLPLFDLGSVEIPGSARVSRTGDSVPLSRTSLDAEQMRSARYSHRRLPHFEKPWAIYAVTIGTKSRHCLSPKARTIVLDSLRHFRDKRYELFAVCVMPDHVHLLMQPWPKENNERGNVIFWPLSELLQSIKSFSAHEINKLEGKRGAVWEKEKFDRYVRSDRDLEEKFQ
ncbi:MAG: DEAD/DEAH box helicase, partial [Chthoniobacterales bacterium]